MDSERVSKTGLKKKNFKDYEDAAGKVDDSSGDYDGGMLTDDTNDNGDDVYKYDISAVHRAALWQFESWKRDLWVPRGRPAQVYNARGGDRHDDQ